MIGTEPLQALQVSTHGPVERNDLAYAKDKVSHLFRMAAGPVLHATVRLTQEADPARERRAVAEATLDVDGRFARAHVSAPTMHEAVDLLEARLRRRLLMLAERAESKRLRHRGGREHEWRRGDARTHRPQYYERPIDEREIVRRKSFELDELTVDEAAFEMELLAHDFFLFSELATGVDSVVYRRRDGSFGLLQPAGTRADLTACVASVHHGDRVAGNLTDAEAVELLDLTDDPFVFYVDEATGRGRVLYRRYDGHYGLVAC
ncbi:MAG: sigma 54 modulation/S30EA ribosomal C-terminal domain-containing protein [Acidimicrobiia bacterium]